jgi:hypothetical protein
MKVGSAKALPFFVCVVHNITVTQATPGGIISPQFQQYSPDKKMTP